MVVTSGVIFDVPDPYEALSTENLPRHLGIVQDFFASKLATNNGRPLVDDEDLPPKQRFPKPRLGPAGKISSPRKRPLREQQQAAKKKRKLEEMGKPTKPIAPLKLEMPKASQKGHDPEKDEARSGPLISPESITAA